MCLYQNSCRVKFEVLHYTIVFIMCHGKLNVTQYEIVLVSDTTDMHACLPIVEYKGHEVYGLIFIHVH